MDDVSTAIEISALEGWLRLVERNERVLAASSILITMGAMLVMVAALL